jgi:hypothetical protein
MRPSPITDKQCVAYLVIEDCALGGGDSLPHQLVATVVLGIALESWSFNKTSWLGVDSISVMLDV